MFFMNVLYVLNKSYIHIFYVMFHFLFHITILSSIACEGSDFEIMKTDTESPWKLL